MLHHFQSIIKTISISNRYYNITFTTIIIFWSSIWKRWRTNEFIKRRRLTIEFTFRCNRILNWQFTGKNSGIPDYIINYIVLITWSHTKNSWSGKSISVGKDKSTIVFWIPFCVVYFTAWYSQFDSNWLMNNTLFFWEWINRLSENWLNTNHYSTGNWGKDRIGNTHRNGLGIT